MLNLFITLNARLWWRSLKGSELAAIIFYSIFLLLVFSQFVGVAVTLLFAPDLEIVRGTYPWLTSNVQLTIHLVFINALWITQFFFTKISRLRLHDNRKLLALGMPVKKLSYYLNTAGFLHPLNILFHLFWLIYLGLMTSSPWHFLVIVLFVFVNYGLISLFKWRFKLFSSKSLKVVNGILGLTLLSLLIFVPAIDTAELIVDPETVTRHLLSWLSYTPGALIYFLAAELSSAIQINLVIAILAVMFVYLHYQLISKTRTALLTPQSGSSLTYAPSRLAFFKNWLGLEGGKYIYNVWNHSYTKTQLAISFLIPAFYIFLMSDGTSAGNFMVVMFLTLLPSFFLMLLITNMFGFENRELLLSLQSPSSIDYIVKERVKSALKLTAVALIIAVLLVPLFFDSFLSIIQIILAITFVLQAILLFVIKSSINNYKKIEDVGLMSVSNPVIPASITFVCMFIILLLGLISFIVVEQFQWAHISILLFINIVLAAVFMKKVKRIGNLFKSKIIPQLWNEL
ncbi:MAG: hypothetical protein WD604_04720 [Balneolaceae bacterium]